MTSVSEDSCTPFLANIYIPVCCLLGFLSPSFVVFPSPPTCAVFVAEESDQGFQEHMDSYAINHEAPLAKVTALAIP